MASATGSSFRAAYRSVRNTIASILGAVIVVALLAGLRGDGVLDVVRSVWSMKPPRVVTVERVLTVDLPPFTETAESRDPVGVRPAEIARRQARPAGATGS